MPRIQRTGDTLILRKKEKTQMKTRNPSFYCFLWLRVLGLGVLGMPVPAVAQDRAWLPEPREIAAYTDESGELFGNPHRVFPSPRGGFVLDDWADGSIREFSAAGEMVWRFGRFGSGPGEFARMMDVEFDASGNLIVMDLDQHRVTVVDPSGNLVDTHYVPDAEQVLPRTFHSGHWAVMPRLLSRMDTLWVSRAHAASRFVAQPTALGLTAPHALEGWATNLVDGGAVIHFRWSSQIVVLSHAGSVRTVFDGIEPIPFPDVVVQDVEPPPQSELKITAMRVTRVDPKAVPASMKASVHGSRIYVFFAGSTDNAFRIVDTYSADGTYLGSYLLPHSVRSAVVLRDGQLATLETALIPTVRLWSLDGFS